MRSQTVNLPELNQQVDPFTNGMLTVNMAYLLSGTVDLFSQVVTDKDVPNVVQWLRQVTEDNPKIKIRRSVLTNTGNSEITVTTNPSLLKNLQLDHQNEFGLLLGAKEDPEDDNDDDQDEIDDADDPDLLDDGDDENDEDSDEDSEDLDDEDSDDFDGDDPDEIDLEDDDPGDLDEE